MAQFEKQTIQEVFIFLVLAVRPNSDVPLGSSNESIKHDGPTLPHCNLQHWNQSLDTSQTAWGQHTTKWWHLFQCSLLSSYFIKPKIRLKWIDFGIISGLFLCCLTKSGSDWISNSVKWEVGESNILCPPKHCKARWRISYHWLVSNCHPQHILTWASLEMCEIIPFCVLIPFDWHTRQHTMCKSKLTNVVM